MWKTSNDNVMVSPTFIALAVTIIYGIIAVLIGLAYRNIIRRIRKLEGETTSSREARVGCLQRVNTLWRWAFGREDDVTDRGISQDIESGFDRIEEDIEELDRKNQTHHNVQIEHLRRLVNKLHDEEALEIERDDILETDVDSRK